MLTLSNIPIYSLRKIIKSINHLIHRATDCSLFKKMLWDTHKKGRVLTLILKMVSHFTAVKAWQDFSQFID